MDTKYERILNKLFKINAFRNEKINLDNIISISKVFLNFFNLILRNWDYHQTQCNIFMLEAQMGKDLAH